MRTRFRLYLGLRMLCIMQHNGTVAGNSCLSKKPNGNTKSRCLHACAYVQTLEYDAGFFRLVAWRRQLTCPIYREESTMFQYDSSFVVLGFRRRFRVYFGPLLPIRGPKLAYCSSLWCFRARLLLCFFLFFFSLFSSSFLSPSSFV